MNAAQVDFQYPILGFSKDGCFCFRDLDMLTRCSALNMRLGEPLGMELIDSALHRWVVRRIQHARRIGTFAAWLLLPVMGPPSWRLDYELEALGPVRLDDAKDSICAYIEAHAIDMVHCYDEPSQLLPLFARVRAATSIAELCEQSCIDWLG